MIMSVYFVQQSVSLNSTGEEFEFLTGKCNFYLFSTTMTFKFTKIVVTSGGYILACEDLRGMFTHSFPACALKKEKRRRLAHTH